MPQAPKRVLIAALDWGLGHATRCMPIIDQLLESGAQVYLAGAGRSARLLRLRYPSLPFLNLSPYKVRYSKSYFLLLGLIAQVPRLLRVIENERYQLSQFQQQYHFQLLISDNRYGLHLKGVPSVFICHQLAPLPWPNWRSLHWLIYRLHRLWFKPFSSIWIPDFATQANLSGRLSHRFAPPENARFIGPLSRFEKASDPSVRPGRKLPPQAPSVLIILSGPEPQRTYLEQKIREQWHRVKETIWLVQGKTETENYEICNSHHLISFLETEDLQWALQNAEVVISRPGYSSIMDYAVLGLRQVVLIPTPGQTEQQYLAKGLDEQEIALCVNQSNFKLVKALQMIKSYTGFEAIETDSASLRSALEEALALS
ncbi:MAG: glycosyltransferase [Bacteroidia bacterium]